MSIFQLVSLFLLIFSFRKAYADNPCGEWEPYKDEKCLKIFNEPGLIDYDDAENYCKSTDSSNLISIGYEEKQQFLVNFLKSNQVLDNVWIGLKYVGGEYQWSDDTELHYTNWAANSPKNDSNYCVQIQTDENEFAKWSDVLCAKKNLVICEKLQTWDLSHLQNAVIDLQFALNQSTIRISQLETEVTSISKNPIPIGFIYVQLPNQDLPSDIWPLVEWENVSPDYAGVFFRAEGGNASDFGKIQAENSPRLVSAVLVDTTNGGDFHTVTIVANDQYSQPIGTHGDPDATIWNLELKVSGGEVRPTNMAVRIWKRIK